MEFLLCANNVGAHDAGDIIDIKPDNFNWGAGERNNPVFKIVRIANADVGNNLSALQDQYLGDTICYCSVCSKYVYGSDANAHVQDVHSDMAVDVLTGRTKSLDAVGVAHVKDCRWVVDGEGFADNQAEICEKVFANNDTEIAYVTRLSTSVVVL